MELKDLVGEYLLQGIETGVTSYRFEYGFYVGDCNYIKFTLDGVTYMAVENPDDRYRSYLEELQIVEEPCKTKLPDIRVVCLMAYERLPDSEVLDFYDANNSKQILSIGTENTDDYYPYCVIEYSPENMSINEK